ncbi:MAG TPA: alpha/beta hydrolase [Candidatus Eisenbacteria bacterium]|nr:alpha/beta hydrolase [Candidatus Eisenbacteria bacterium]
MSDPTIVLVHGNFVTKRSWDGWVRRYEAKGHRCLAIEYPLRDEPVEVLRKRHPDPATGRLTLGEVLEHHLKILRALPEKPIVMGHSFGGFLTQLLVQRDVAAAAVAIDSVPPAGVPPIQLSALRSLWPVFNPLKPRTEPYLMSFKEFQYAFVHTLPLDEQRRAYDKEVVPESRVLASGALSPLGRVDFQRDRAPLLFIAGEVDHIMPARLNRTNYERYRSSPAITEFKEFPGRTHYLIAEPRWEEVADFALDWALGQVRAFPKLDTASRI